MKITSVDIYTISAKWRRGWNPVVIRINTDESVNGWGEAGVAVGGGTSAYAAMVKDLTAMHLIGADPLQHEALWEKMFRRTWLSQGGGPVVYAGFSAIDQALWDIRGKAFGVPVYQLLGGKTNEKIRAYASQIQFGWPANQDKPAVSAEDFAQAARHAVAEGFTAVKVDPTGIDEKGNRNHPWDLTKPISAHTVKVIYERVEAIRKAVGPDIDVIMECHAGPTTPAAIQIGQAIEGLNIMYYEEPVNSNNVEAMAKVAENVKIPLAAGEHIYTRWGFRPYLEKQILTVVQPDLCVAGGITEGKKISDLAHIYDASVQCHCLGSPIAQAAALHLETAIPNFIIHEHVFSSGVKENLDLATTELKMVNGYFTVPEGPGLGIEMNVELLAQYPHFRVG